MSFSEDILMAYADDQLDPQVRAQVQVALGLDPVLAQRVSQHSALRTRLRDAFDRVLDEPVPERLVATARRAPTLQPLAGPRPRSNVIPLRRRTQPPRWSRTHMAALGVSLVTGIALGQLLPRAVTTEPLTPGSDGELRASNALRQALSSQLAGERPDPQDREPVQIGVSFRSRTGDYCRTFLLQGMLAGLACHVADGWRVRVLAETLSQDLSLGVAPALPRRIIQTVEQQLAPAPLDARAEAAARARDWKP